MYGDIDGPIVMIGFGSIGRGTLPLIERHFKFDRSRFVVIDPDDRDRAILQQHGIRFIHQAVTRDRYRRLLEPLLTAGGGRGFCVNLSVDTSSLDIMRLCRELGSLYIDTVVEPWPGFYFDRSVGPEARTNNALRNTVREEKARQPGGVTAVSCCGANPGMVSWFVKQALQNLARDLGRGGAEPASDDQVGWATLMRDLGVKGIHIAERDTQRARTADCKRSDRRQEPISCSPGPTRGSARGARPPVPSTAFSSPTTSRSRSPIISRSATAIG
jgi:homospermidine synthase